MRAAFASPRLLLVVLLAVLAACASIPGTVSISRQQLQSALERRFPYEARAGGLFQVRAAQPRLALLPESNRLRVDLALDVSERIARSAVHGDLALSFGLRYEPADATLRAVDVRVEDLQLQGVPQRWQGPAQVAGTLVVEHALRDAVLHTFRADQLARAQGRSPGAIRVTPGGLEVELVPAPSGG